MKRRHEADSTGTTAFKQTKSDTTFDKKVNTDNNSKFKEPVSSIKVDVKDELKGEVKNDGFEKKENDEFNNENNGSCSTDTVMNNIFNASTTPDDSKIDVNPIPNTPRFNSYNEDQYNRKHYKNDRSHKLKVAKFKNDVVTIAENNTKKSLLLKLDHYIDKHLNNSWCLASIPRHEVFSFMFSYGDYFLKTRNFLSNTDETTTLSFVGSADAQSFAIQEGVKPAYINSKVDNLNILLKIVQDRMTLMRPALVLCCAYLYKFDTGALSDTLHAKKFKCLS